MKKALLSITIPFLILSIAGCKNIAKNDKSFNEEFVNVETIHEYFLFEKKMFSDEVFEEVEGISNEDWNRRILLYDSAYLFNHASINKELRLLTFKNRDYYCAFYSHNPTAWNNKKTYNFHNPGMIHGYNYLEHKDDSYVDYVKFKNYYSLKQVKYEYDGFYLYNLIQLIDVFDGKEKIATTFRYQYYLFNDKSQVCYYDLPDYYSNTYQPYNTKNKYLTYYDSELFKNRTVVPYFYQPYEHSCLMGSRVEVDGKYAYFPHRNDRIEKRLSTLEDGSTREIHGELLKKKRKIKDYDISKQKNITKEVEDVYYRVPLEELKLS